MSAFVQELEASTELLGHERIGREQARAQARSLAWFKVNWQALEAAGWTVTELYRVGTLPLPYSEWGPGWLPLWNNEKCEPRLDGRGNIEFVLHEAGGEVIQTCWREKFFLS